MELIRRQLISIIIIWGMIWGGFFGLMVFNDKEEIGVAEAAIIIVDINGGGSHTNIQYAIDNATEGDTIRVWDGTYYENIIVNKTVTLIGNGTINTVINGAGINDVVFVSEDWVNISGFSAKNSGSKGTGIKLDNVNNCSIGNVNCTQNYQGIYLNYSDDNIISNSTGYLNNWSGIYLYNSHFNLLYNTSLNRNKVSGLYLYLSKNNTVKNSSMRSNQGVSGHGILIASASNNTIDNCDISSNNANGMYVRYALTFNTIITHNDIYLNSGNGIAFQQSCNNIVRENRIFDNVFDGIVISQSSDNVKVSNNNVSFNSRYGIHISSSDQNKIDNNTCYNTNYGVYITTSSTKNVLIYNYLKNNNNGIYVTSSNNNIFFRNRFLLNTIHSYDDGNNIWNASLPLGGNYWDTWTSPDDDSDGFVDKSYSIPGGTNKDYYPLTKINWTIMKVYNLNKQTWHKKIQEGIDNASSGDSLWVKNGTYYENVIINKTITLIGESRNDTIINGNGSGSVVLITADWVNITRFTLTNSGLVYPNSGIRLEYANNCNINDNDCIYNISRGITLKTSSNNTIANNNCSFSSASGIVFDYSSNNNTIENNNCYFNGADGIAFYHSSNNNIVRNNTCSSDFPNVVASGLYVDSSANIIFENNSCSFHIQGIRLSFSSNITVINNICYSNRDVGIRLFSANQNIIDNNLCTKNEYGIILSHSSNTTIKNNNCSFNVKSGIYLRELSMNRLSSNKLFNNDVGLELRDSDINNIEKNEFVNNRLGINLSYGSKRSLFANNTIENSTEFDLRAAENSNGILLNCTFNENKILFADPLSNLTIKWYMHIKAVNSSGGRIQDAEIEVRDNKSDQVFWGKTGINGLLKWIICSEYVKNMIGKISIETPHNITGKHAAYETGYATPEPVINTSKIVTVELPYDVTPPNPPLEFKFTSIGGNHINLSWKGSNSSDLVGYNIYINDTGSSTTFHLLGSTSNTFYNCTGLPEETTSHFRIRAYDGVPWESSFISDFNTTIDITPPEPPTSFIVSIQGGTTISLTWTASISTDVQGYQIYVNDTSSTTMFHLLDLTSSTSYIHSNLPEEVMYYYKIRGYDEVPWYSIYTVTKSLKTHDITAPSAPTGLVAKDPTGHEIDLEWNSNPESDISGYKIFINETGSGAAGPFYKISQVSSTTTGYKVVGLIEETTYYFVILAFDEVPNNSSFSNVASSTTLDVTPPSYPKLKNAAALSENEVHLEWYPNSEADVAGYEIFVNDTSSGGSGTFHHLQTSSGTGTEYILSGLSAKTRYYFRIRAYDEVPNYSYLSGFVFVDIPDETPPSAPTGLKVSDHTYNSLLLQWDPNPEKDLVGYNLYRNRSVSGNFMLVNTDLIEDTRYTDTSLDDSTTYYYKLKAVDDFDLLSEFSIVASGTTMLGPYPPVIYNPVEALTILEDSYDDTSINLHDWFKDINNDPLQFWIEPTGYIKVTIFDDNGTVVLQPDHNWNGEVMIRFYAKDSTGSVYDDVKITVKGVNDPPERVRIFEPRDDHEILSGQQLNLDGSGTDPDIPYGDTITYKWISNISGVIGEEDTLGHVLLPVGYQKITFEVTDSHGITASDSINVMVKASDLEDSDDDGMFDAWEVQYGLNPNDPTDGEMDEDNDGLLNFEEYQYRSDPHDIDTDSDGVTDGDEVKILRTDPIDPDTDDDGLNDLVDPSPKDPYNWDETKEDAGASKTSQAVIGVIIFVIIIIVILILYFVLKPRFQSIDEFKEVKKDKDERKPPPGIPQAQPPIDPEGDQEPPPPPL